MEALTPAAVRTLLDTDAEADVVGRLVATGAWSEAGAAEIVAFLRSGPDGLLKAGVNGERRRGPLGPGYLRLLAFRAGRIA